MTLEVQKSFLESRDFDKIGTLSSKPTEPFTITLTIHGTEHAEVVQVPCFIQTESFETLVCLADGSCWANGERQAPDLFDYLRKEAITDESNKFKF